MISYLDSISISWLYGACFFGFILFLIPTGYIVVDYGLASVSVTTGTVEKTHSVQSGRLQEILIVSPLGSDESESIDVLSGTPGDFSTGQTIRSRSVRGFLSNTLYRQTIRPLDVSTALSP